MYTFFEDFVKGKSKTSAFTETLKWIFIVKTLLCKPANLNLDFRHPHKKLGMAIHTSTTEIETNGSFGLALARLYLVDSRICERDSQIIR